MEKVRLTLDVPSDSLRSPQGHRLHLTLSTPADFVRFIRSRRIDVVACSTDGVRTKAWIQILPADGPQENKLIEVPGSYGIDELPDRLRASGCWIYR